MINNWKRFFTPRSLIICGLFGVFLFLSGVILGFQILPNIIENKIWETKILTKNTEQWDMFMKFPFPFTFKVYLFNVENPDDVLVGAKPVVREIGPYIYNLYRWKSEVEWQSEDDISYNDYMRFEFNQNESGHLTKDDYVTTLNSPFNSLLLTVEQLSPDMLASVDSALPTVFGNYNGIFTKVKVRDYLFDGLRLCEDGGKRGGFLSKAVCGQMIKRAEKTKPMRVVNNTVIFANFHFKNNTHQGRFTIKSGRKNRNEAAKLILYDNEDHVNAWVGTNSSCNKIRGLTTVFPVKVNKDMVFDVFAEDICRVITMEYKREQTIKEVPGYRFGAQNNTFSNSKDNACFCVNQSKTMNDDLNCLRDGILDLSTCTGAPVLLSFPHLLFADQLYLDSVEGLKPDIEKHESHVVLEPVTGTPLKLAKRVQFNMFIRPLDGISTMGNISRALVPIFWIEESLVLDDKYVDLLNNKLLFGLKIFGIGKWVVILSGFGLIVTPVFIFIYMQE